jgi:NTP pyrophosphatase (non-canonical NTP hydrolase)
MPEKPLSLDEYQRLAARTDIETDNDDPLVPLLGLAGEIGELAAELKKQQRADGVRYSGFEEAVATELGDILWYLAALARRTGHNLADIAQSNLRKTSARWLPPDAPRVAFDTDFPPAQRLPRQIEVTFRRDGDRIQMLIGDEELGDPIDDNSKIADHYRFHDVFHLSYAAVLGWSPILRSLLGRKRKLDEVIDRVEDGARARATEEAIAAMVFKMAEPYDFFEGQTHVDDRILAAVSAVASGLEVKDRSPAEWEEAILAGFSVWRQLREKGEGTIRVDLAARALSFDP